MRLVFETHQPGGIKKEISLPVIAAIRSPPAENTEDSAVRYARHLNVVTCGDVLSDFTIAANQTELPNVSSGYGSDHQRHPGGEYLSYISHYSCPPKYGE
jgi:hypothetical protein